MKELPNLSHGGSTIADGSADAVSLRSFSTGIPVSISIRLHLGWTPMCFYVYRAHLFIFIVRTIGPASSSFRVRVHSSSNTNVAFLVRI